MNYRLILFPVLIYLFCYSCSIAQQVPRDTTNRQKSDTTEISLLFAGDVMGHMPQINAAYDTATGNYNFNPVFELVRPVIVSADLAVANLETTLAGKPYSGYPQFSAPDSLARALKNAGFDLLITANNHCLDRGAQGLERTVAMLDSIGIPHTGTFINKHVRSKTYPYLVTLKGIKLAILNTTYGTNGIPVHAPNIVNYIDTVQILEDLAVARKMNPDYVIMTTHWGIEYERKENSNQRDLAAFMLRNGVDMVIGSHPHVVQPIRKYYNHPDSADFQVVVYSMGNYVSNQRDRYKDGGLMVMVKLRKISHVQVADLTYLPVWVFKGNLDTKLQYKLIPMNKPLPEWLEEGYKAKADTFLTDTRENIPGVPMTP